MKKRNNIVNFRFLLSFLLLYGLVAVCYYPVFSNGFLDSWDDQWMVMNVFTESGFRMENLIAVFTQSYKGQYSSLVELGYMVLYGLFGVLYSFHKKRLLISIDFILLAIPIITVNNGRIRTP